MAGRVDRDRAALNRPPRWLVPALAVVPAVVLVGFYLAPLITLLARVVEPGSVGVALDTPGLRHVLWFTLWQALASTVLTLVVGFVPAYLLEPVSIDASNWELLVEEGYYTEAELRN